MGIRKAPRSGDVGICMHKYIPGVNMERWISEQPRQITINLYDVINFLISGLKGLKVGLNSQENILFWGVKLVSTIYSL